ncbi:Riboflavin biosynthesis protein RibD [Corynebacterium capitovis DSM 44611]|uniref:bifunctional diaminohydroxyphosphoribosylaminopyrimidine deaminase/5-amino-6-(5-phosphoribosylamino)uracil reductase RibD n=1 Tax=Corynebacterium capitovis TaxID=131081 RepID=UPI00036C87F6|nr:bifunctional diaminohydroxyphosphoribosylaminopyrimidine deaminase/5-amino-6-(5-phosphoribosylamino)uracil reductase RibD [Corynebacterium capitovis]WKD57608.1 Riboflavin biosynthesis protein RibD [Corynebacterium capitovis DSM 44611]
MLAGVEEALAAGERARGTTSPNPPVGCAIVSPDGKVIATGSTSPVGGPHAEVNALRAAGSAARGATAVVTLEPCNHVGRTGPCTVALLDAGIRAVIYLARDPHPLASGGAEFLRSHGVETTHVPSRVAALEPWLASVRHERVSVTAKFASTIDGFTAAPDGTSQWITGAAARDYVHRDRAKRDAIVVGSGTVLADNPSLTARRNDGSLYATQPRRVVVGKRDVPPGNLHDLGFEQYGTPEDTLAALWESGARDVLVEGGARLLSSVFELGVVDRIQAYLAPVVLGGGRGVVDRALAETLGDAQRYTLTDLRRLGDDVLVEMER